MMSIKSLPIICSLFVASIAMGQQKGYYRTPALHGNKFPTPFAKPPGQGLSSSTVNVIGGLFNLLVGYLLFRAGHVATEDVCSLIVFFAGMAFLSIMISKHFTTKDKE